MADAGAPSPGRASAVLGGIGIALAALGWFTVPFVVSDVMLLDAVLRSVPQDSGIPAILVPTATLLAGALPPVVAAFMAARLIRRPGHINFLLGVVTVAILSVDVLTLLVVSVTAAALGLRH